MRVLLAILLCIGSISYAEDRTISITGNSINDNSNDILEWVIVGASATHEAGGFLRYLIIRNM